MGCSSTTTEAIVKTSIKLLLCPLCTTSIPLITLQLGKGNFNLITKCTCSPEENRISLKEFIDFIKKPYVLASNCIIHERLGEKYCLNTATWLCRECLIYCKANPQNLDLIDNRISVTCLKHSKPFCSYCQECQDNICPLCKDEHIDHELLQLTEIDDTLIETYYNFLSSLLPKNKQIHERIINEIDNEIKQQPIKGRELIQLKEDILTTWKTNQQVNILLKEFYKCFYITASALKRYPCYQLFTLFTTIQINEINLDFNYLTVKERAIEWKNYLDYNWLVIQKEKDNTMKIVFKKKTEEIKAKPKRIKIPTKFECFGTLTEHNYPVRCLVKVNEDRLASGSDDKTIKILNISTMTCENTLIGHVNSVWCLTVLHDGTLVSGSNDKLIKFWTTESWICKATLFGHSYSVRCLVQLDERTLASGSVDKTIKLWNIITLTCKYTFTGHSSFVWCFAQINLDILASGSEDATIKLWNTTTMDYKTTLKGHTLGVKSLVLLNDNNLMSGSTDTFIKVWNITKLTCIATLKGHESSVECLIKLNDKTLISGSDDKTIKVWKKNSLKCNWSLTGHKGYIWCLSKLNSNQFASGSWDNTVKLWSIPHE